MYIKTIHNYYAMHHNYYCSYASALFVDIIIVAVLLAVLVLILMISIITCVIFALGAKRKSSWSGTVC